MSDELQNIKKMRDYKRFRDVFASNEALQKDVDIIVDSASGIVNVGCKAVNDLYFKVLSQICGDDVDDDYKLLAYVKSWQALIGTMRSSVKLWKKSKNSDTAWSILRLRICSLRNPNF